MHLHELQASLLRYFCDGSRAAAQIQTDLNEIANECLFLAAMLGGVAPRITPAPALTGARCDLGPLASCGERAAHAILGNCHARARVVLYRAECLSLSDRPVL